MAPSERNCSGIVHIVPHLEIFLELHIVLKMFHSSVWKNYLK